jgi:hypothetical protein
MIGSSILEFRLEAKSIVGRDQRNHCLKYESDCVGIGIGIKIFMKRGRVCKRSFRWVFVIHTAIERKHSFCFRTSFHSCRVSYENCKRPRRKYHKKWELLCNSHISLQFSYQFAIFISVCNSQILVYSSYVDVSIFFWVCNFHSSLQFSYQFAFLASQLQHLITYIALPEFYVIKSMPATVLHGRLR